MILSESYTENELFYVNTLTFTSTNSAVQLE